MKLHLIAEYWIQISHKYIYDIILQILNDKVINDSKALIYIQDYHQTLLKSNIIIYPIKKLRIKYENLFAQLEKEMNSGPYGDLGKLINKHSSNLDRTQIDLIQSLIRYIPDYIKNHAKKLISEIKDELLNLGGFNTAGLSWGYGIDTIAHYISINHFKKFYLSVMYSLSKVQSKRIPFDGLFFV